MSAAGVVHVVAGPFDPIDRDYVVATLSQISHGGADARVGLMPDKSTRSWTVADNFTNGYYEVRLLESSSPVAVLARMGTVEPEKPIVVGSDRGYIVVSFNHGLGDSHVMMEILAALSRGSDSTTTESGYSDPAPHSGFRWAFPVVVVRAIASNPRAAASAFRELMEHRRTSGTSAVPTSAGEGVNSVPTQDRKEKSESRSVVFVESGPNFLESLNARRRALPYKISANALVVYSIQNALLRHGLDMDESVEVLVDLRRHLPRERGTLGNLVAVAPIPLRRDSEAVDFGSDFRRYTASSLPVLLLAGAAVKRQLARPAKPMLRRLDSSGRPKRSESTPHMRPTLTVSDITNHPSVDKLRWKAAVDDRIFAISLPPGGTDRLSVAVARHANRLQFTATFDGASIDPRSVEGAFRDVVSEPFGVKRAADD
ncbi:hypothetical protein [Gordonia sp. NPDC003422]